MKCFLLLHFNKCVDVVEVVKVNLDRDALSIRNHTKTIMFDSTLNIRWVKNLIIGFTS